MFICCNKNLHIKEGSETLNLANGFMGDIDDRWAGHWYIKAAMKDGTIVANEPKKEKKPAPAKTDGTIVDDGKDAK